MKKSITLLFTLLLLLPLMVSADGIVDVNRPTDAPSFLGYVQDRIIVVMKPESGKLKTEMSSSATVHIGDAEFDAISDKYSVSKIEKQFKGSKEGLFSKTAELAKFHKITFNEGSLDEVVAAYENNPLVEKVERIGIHKMFATPNDTYFDPYQWYHNQTNDDDIDSPEAWNVQTGNSSIVLAILDSGTRYYHPDLGGANASSSNPSASRGNMWTNSAELNGTAGVDDDGNGYVDDWIGYDFIDGVSNCWSGEDCNTKDNDPRDFNGHGTHTAGIVGMMTNNGYGMAGVAGGWGNGSQEVNGNGVKVMPLRMGYSYNYLGQEYGVVQMDAAAEAFYYAADNGAKVASCSWGTSNSGGIGAAATYFINNGGLIFVAAGNDGTQTADYFNSRSDIISVAATDQNDGAASFTTYGTWVDISAPGVGIYSTYHDHTDPTAILWASLDGTSMATPMAAGVAAMIWSQNPSWTNTQVEAQLYASADNIEAELDTAHKNKMGVGRINLFNAVNTGPPPAPVANFSGSPTTGTEPLSVNFTDASTGSITNWLWNFGDGNTSTSQNPSHTYTSAGTYTVALEVNGPGGNDTNSKTNYITVNACVIPTAGFSGTPTSGDYPLNVSFSNSSSSATSYSWNFGDGGSSTATNPSHTYTSAGTFTVTLTATNSCGSDQQVNTNYITVTTPPCDVPVASFSGSPTSGNNPLNVSFTDASTNSPTSWSWTFGDGGTSTAQNPSHTYTAAGTYSVSLTATNSCGSNGTTLTNYITVTEPPVGGFCDDFADADISDWTVISGTWTPSGGQLDGFISSGNAFIMSPMGTITDATITVDWTSLTGGTWTNGIVVFGFVNDQNYRVADFRDGANNWYIREFIGGTQYNRASFAETINTNQQYAMEVVIDPSGLVTVSADGVQKVSYNFGNVQAGQVGLEVNQSHSVFDNFCVDSDPPPPPAPTAEFSGTPTSGDFPLNVNFTDLSTDAPTSWAWTFGDGGTSTAQNPSHTYTAAGTYSVSLTATNAQGSDVATKTNYITVTDPGGGGWTTITYDDFEAGWGNYSDGGNDCARYTGGTYSAEGAASVQIRDNSGVASSFYHSSGYDVSGYQQLEVTFDFVAVSMDNSNEDFWVQYYDGSSWVTLATFAQGIDFDNNVFYSATVTWNSSQVSFPTNAQLRFMCDASGNRDYVYIDIVDFHGTTTPAASSGGPILLSSSSSGVILTEMLPEEFELTQNYPNPFNPSTSIEFNLPQSEHVKISVYNVLGQQIAVLADQQFNAGVHSVDWDASSVSSGIYLYRFESASFTETKKMVLLK